MAQGTEFYNAYDISEKLGICYAKALEWIKYSGIGYTKVGKTYHVRISTFNKFTEGETDDK